MKSDWNARFARAEYLYGKEANTFVKEIVPVIKPEGRLLAIAEGEGRNALFVAEDALQAGRKIEIDLWDYSDVALQKVNARKGLLPIYTKEVDLTNISWPTDLYDYAMCVYGHFSKEMQLQVFQGIRQALKPGGYFFGEVYSEAQLPYRSGGPRNIDYLYDPALFLEVFKADHFQHLFMGEVERTEGDLHQGRCHVIQFAIQIVK